MSLKKEMRVQGIVSLASRPARNIIEIDVKIDGDRMTILQITIGELRDWIEWVKTGKHPQQEGD